MKLLFDQNLSHKLVSRVADVFPDSAHVRSFGMQEADDSQVWQFAADNEYVIVSKDEDFHQMSFLHGPPPKVVWLRIGNCTTEAMEAVLRRHHDDIIAFCESDEGAFMIAGE